MKNSCVARQKTETSIFVQSRNQKRAFSCKAENKTGIFLQGRKQKEHPVAKQKIKDHKRYLNIMTQKFLLDLTLYIILLYNLKLGGFYYVLK